VFNIEYDRRADAIYVRLRDVPYSYGYSVDESRRIDYGEDREPVGVELLDVSAGVDLRGIPRAAEIAEALRRYDIPIAV